MASLYSDLLYFSCLISWEHYKICEKVGINAWEVIELANKHPRVNLHQPGPGVGGHCLAIDPWFIIEKNPDLARIIKMSRDTNESMPQHVLGRIDAILKNIKGSRKVTILGIAYKPNIDDTRESPILKLIDLLDKKGNYKISVYDPHVKSYKYQARNLIEAAEDSDLIVLAVNHDEFKYLPLDDMGNVMRNKILFDTRNFFNRYDVENKGFRYELLGEGEKQMGLD